MIRFLGLRCSLSVFLCSSLRFLCTSFCFRFRCLSRIENLNDHLLVLPWYLCSSCFLKQLQTQTSNNKEIHSWLACLPFTASHMMKQSALLKRKSISLTVVTFEIESSESIKNNGYCSFSSSVVHKGD